ncbi:uncharacterized protein M6G45_015677 isoform 2-T2 [Spheniscus humboldti]
MWVLRPGGGGACSDLCPAEENPYEPLDPPIAVPSQKHVTDPPASGCWSREKLVLVGTVALGVSVLMNVLFLAVGSRHVAALTAALEAEKAKVLPNVASRSFLLYNEDHRKCVEASGQQLTATACRPEAAAQRFQWLDGGRLRVWGSQRCVTATRRQNLALVRLEPCRDDGTLQRWECRDGGLLALAGYDLYFNYGNNRQDTAVPLAPKAGPISGTPAISTPRQRAPGRTPSASARSWARSSWRWTAPRRRITSGPCSKAPPGLASGMRRSRAPGSGRTGLSCPGKAARGTGTSPTVGTRRTAQW